MKGTETRFVRSFVLGALSAAAALGIVPGSFAQEREDFVDEWVSVNPWTDSITRIVVDEFGGDLSVHAFGSCSPTDCDWGEIVVPFEEYPLVAVYEQGFVTTTLRMCMAGPEHLFVASDEVFHDGTGRDFSAEGLFRRWEDPPGGAVDVDELVDTWIAVYPDPPVRDGLPTVLMREAVIERDGNQLIITASGDCRATECEFDWGEAIMGARADLGPNAFDAQFDTPALFRQFTFRLVGDDFLYVDGGRRAESVLRRAGSSDICSLDEGPGRISFRRGDCTGDGNVDLSDTVCILNWLFRGGTEPGCVAATNVDGVGEVSITDPIYLLTHLFLGRPGPVNPFPECGIGTLEVDERLGCETPPNGC